MNQIFISQLQLEASIGVYPEEKNTLQPIALDIELTVDLDKAARSDNIADTIDYDSLIKKIQQWVSSQHFHLIEYLANDLANKILSTYPITNIRLKLYKFPKGLPVSSVAVLVERHAPGAK